MRVEFIPVGKVYLTPYQKKEKQIKRLRFWNAILATANVIYTIFAAAVIYMAVAK